MDSIKGILLEPKRFAIHDGPGIRTTFFFKGCVLKCIWCHNPESISPKPQMGYYAHKCINCGECADVCPVKAHTFSADGIHQFDPLLCSDCGKCEEVCLGKALKQYGKGMTVDEVMKIALEDRTFYQESNGGITISGGEPLMQIDFAVALLKELKNAGLHTAVDSCANVATDRFGRVMPYTDMFLIDFKHADCAEHKKLTGSGNELICKNLQWLSDQGARIEIRIPVVPGCNDSTDNMERTADFLSKLQLEAVRLLPYHSLAGSKYGAVNMPDTMPKVPAPDSETMERFAAVLQSRGLTVKY
ncbi:MAG: glycyl-radical enzyme activating protein [Lentisphaeria bacterium]|nr:glycyl-radical enzyme activating protein [Lentisphaeria bacterium]